jgi:two-component system NtrC family sensor kinase
MMDHSGTWTFLSRLPMVNRLSLRTKLVFSFLFVVLAGGILSSLIGTNLVADTIISQARNKVRHDLSTASVVYSHSLNRVHDVVQLTASGRTIPDYMQSGRLRKLADYLVKRRRDFGLDLLTLTDAKGKVILRSRHPFQTGDDQAGDPLVHRALKGAAAASTEIVPREELLKEGRDLAERAFILFVPTPKAREVPSDRETSGMMLKAAAPVRNESGGLVGVLYGGVLLNRNYQIVDKVRDLLYGEGRYREKEMGTATIFQGDLRVSTNVQDENGNRAIGTRVSEEVYRAVVQKGKTWLDRAFVVHDWYITGYEPIRNLNGRIVGILYVGMLEAPYVDLRNKVVYSFFGIGVLGVLVALLLSFFITTGIIRPLREMVASTRKIAEGDLSHEVPLTSQDEIGQLAESFNHMLVSLKEARQEVEDYGRVLEEKVEERSQQLRQIQAKLMQAEKLASLGRLASGVAHEINSPLNGILALSHLLMRRLKDQPDLQKELEIIVKEATRVSAIVRGLLDFSRESKPQKRPCNVNQLILHTLSLVEGQAVFQNIRVVRNLGAQVPILLLDGNQIQQVFMNILLNAADAMANQGTLTITSSHAPGDSFVQVKFTDTGCGIPEENLNKIFDPFFTTKADKKGTGLGLAVSYGIIDRHRGRIEVQSEVGRGTTVAIHLPLEAAEQVPAV